MKYPSKSFLSLFLGTFLFSLVSVLAEAPSDEKPLTIEEGKMMMVEIYGEAKIPMGRLSTKYPELRKADKATRDASRALSEAMKVHPQLKERFDAISEMEISIPEKMKLWQPLFEEAEEIDDLKEYRITYDQARLHALRVEIDALRKEGHDDLGDKLEAVLARVEKPETGE